MMKLKQVGFGVLVSLMAASTSAIGDEDKSTANEEMSKLDKALVKYERTGEMKRCLNPTRIRHSNVVDDMHIIFEVTGRKVYLNTLPRKCSSLGFHRAIKYTVRGGTICKGDLFEVFDSSGIRGVSCSFGEFEKLDLKKDKDDKKEAVSE